MKGCDLMSRLVYDETSLNENIYIETVRPMIEAAFNKAKSLESDGRRCN